MIDRVAASLGRRLVEVPVGFKWFSDGLIDGSLGFGGEESAGASFLRRDGSVWTTDKDGLIIGLLAAEITARSGHDPGQLYDVRHAALGSSFYQRIDAPASREQRERLALLNPDRLDIKELAGEPIERSCRARQATTNRSAASKLSQGADGSPRGHRARKMSIRFTPRVFAAKSIWMTSKMPRKRRLIESSEIMLLPLRRKVRSFKFHLFHVRLRRVRTTARRNP